LRKAATLSIASQLLVGLASAVFLFFVFLGLIAVLTGGPESLVEELLRSGALEPFVIALISFLIAAIALFFIAAILGLLATFVFLVPGVGKLAKWSSAFETPAKLVKWGYWSALALGALALLVVVASFEPLVQAILQQARPEPHVFALQLVPGLSAALALAVLAGIAYLVGFAGLVIALFELSSQTKVGGFKVGAILLIAGLALNLVGVLEGSFWVSLLAVAATIIGWIFARDAAGKALAAALPPPPPPPPSAPA